MNVAERPYFAVGKPGEYPIFVFLDGVDQAERVLRQPFWEESNSVVWWSEDERWAGWYLSAVEVGRFFGIPVVPR